MQNIDDAKALAQSIVSVANGAGVKTKAIITDMNQVLGSTAGNALEMYETVKYLTGKLREPRLHQVVVVLAQAMLVNTGLAENDDIALTKINQVLDNGLAAELFEKMVFALGGPADFLENPWNAMTKANVITEVIAPEHGYIESMNTRDIGMSVVKLGGGRLANGQKIDHSVGIDRILPIGTLVNKGDVVARIHANNNEAANVASQQYLHALNFSQTEPEQTPVIYQIVS